MSTLITNVHKILVFLAQLPPKIVADPDIIEELILYDEDVGNNFVSVDVTH